MAMSFCFICSMKCKEDEMFGKKGLALAADKNVFHLCCRDCVFRLVTIPSLAPSTKEGKGKPLNAYRNFEEGVVLVDDVIEIDCDSYEGISSPEFEDLRSQFEYGEGCALLPRMPSMPDQPSTCTNDISGDERCPECREVHNTPLSFCPCCEKTHRSKYEDPVGPYCGCCFTVHEGGWGCGW